jgi:regulator of sigma E protease
MVSLITAVLVLSVLVLVHELGHFLVARRAGVGVEKFSIGFGPRVWGVRRGETEYLIGAIPLGGYVKMVGEHGEEHEGDGEPPPPPDPAKSFEKKSVWARMLIVAAGPVFNFLFAICVYDIVFMAGVPVMLATVGAVQADFPAAAAGLQSGDTIVAIDGRAVETWDDITAAVHPKAGVELTFTVRRGAEDLRFRITPKSSPSTSVFGEKTSVGLVGIAPGDKTTTKRFGPVDALVLSVERTGEIARLTLVGIVKIFQGVVPANSIGGPIMIAQMAGQQAQLGLMNLVALTAFLSISLGLFNLFPIPVLDGGQIWFFAIEAVRGRPLSRRVREIAQQVGLVLLLLLMVFAFYNDITRWITGK